MKNSKSGKICLGHREEPDNGGAVLVAIETPRKDTALIKKLEGQSTRCEDYYYLPLLILLQR